MAEPRIRIERVIPAPIEDVYRAWTNPEEMAVWFSPVGHAEVEADVRENGKFRLTMKSEGVQIDHDGEYVKVDPPRLLSFTWRSPFTGGAYSLVTVSLVPQGSDTHLTLLHERLPDEAAESHRGGWGEILERLAALLMEGR